MKASRHDSEADNSIILRYLFISANCSFLLILDFQMALKRIRVLNFVINCFETIKNQRGETKRHEFRKIYSNLFNLLRLNFRINF